MGCGSSNQSAGGAKLKIPRKLNPDTTIMMYFKYKFNDDATDKDQIFQDFIEHIAAAKKGGNLHTLKLCYTDDGWEAWEVIPSAAHYESHAVAIECSANIAGLMARRSQYTEVDSFIMGQEAEIAKAPKIAEYYPNQKRHFRSPHVHALIPYFGFMNERNGDDVTTTGSPVVYVFRTKYNEGKKEEVIATIDNMLKHLKANKDQINIPLLRFDELGDGYSVTLVAPSVAHHERHMAVLMTNEELM